MRKQHDESGSVPVKYVQVTPKEADAYHSVGVPVTVQFNSGMRVTADKLMEAYSLPLKNWTTVRHYVTTIGEDDEPVQG